MVLFLKYFAYKLIIPLVKSGTWWLVVCLCVIQLCGWRFQLNLLIRSTLEQTLPEIHFHYIIPGLINSGKEGCPLGLNLRVVGRIWSSSIFVKASYFEVKRNYLMTTQCFPTRNTITGEYCAVSIHD